jgi:PilZ domain
MTEPNSGITALVRGGEVLSMSERRERLRTRVVLPLRFSPLSAEEEELARSGKGNLLVADTGLSFPPVWQGGPSESWPPEQESQILHYLQLLDVKLNWIIRRLGDEETTVEAHGETIDLGGNGIRFAAQEPVPVGSLLRIRLQLPPVAPLSVTLLVRVLRVETRTSHAHSNFTCAIAGEFVGIEEMQREQIIQFIFSREREELRRRRDGRNPDS